MTQKDKNIRQLIILGALITLTAVVAMVTGGSDGFDFDRRQFTLDANTIITTVVLESEEQTIRFEYINNRWELNNEYLLDEGMRDVFFSVLSQVEVKRPVSSSESDSIQSYLETEGVKVTVLNNSEVVQSYWTGGNQDLDITYFMTPGDDQAYVMHIPGYQSYIAGIYQAKLSDWRSRIVWDIDWTSLKKLTVEWEGNVTEIEYQGNFMNVNEVSTLDTLAMFNYLETVGYLQTVKYLEKDELPDYQNEIDAGAPLLTMTIEQIGDRISVLNLYKQPDNRQYLPAALNGIDRMLLDPQVLAQLQKKISYFELKE